jgi:hypothetical protein
VPPPLPGSNSGTTTGDWFVPERLPIRRVATWIRSRVATRRPERERRIR